MKHHFGDMLDRSAGHWSIVPNAERYAFRAPEWTSGHKSITIATVSAQDINWELIGTFPNLEELTLHSPSAEQTAFVSRLWRLKRLRITHARPKDISFISRLQNLEELVLEYVSGFTDLSPVGNLKQLRAIHMENMRRVSDFSCLAGAENLKYVSIYGTVDWSQPVDSFDFLSSVPRLEHLSLHFLRAPKHERPLKSLTGLSNLKKLNIGMNVFPLEEFAWIEANIEGVVGAKRPAFVKFGGTDEAIHPRDIRYRMPIEEFNRYSNLFIGADGKRYQRIPHQAALLGRGQRGLVGTNEAVNKACVAHAAKYQNLVTEFKLE